MTVIDTWGCSDVCFTRLACLTALSASEPFRERSGPSGLHQRARWILRPLSVGNVRLHAEHLCFKFRATISSSTVSLTGSHRRMGIAFVFFNEISSPASADPPLATDDSRIDASAVILLRRFASSAYSSLETRGQLRGGPPIPSLNTSCFVNILCKPIVKDGGLYKSPWIAPRLMSNRSEQT